MWQLFRVQFSKFFMYSLNNYLCSLKLIRWSEIYSYLERSSIKYVTMKHEYLSFSFAPISSMNELSITNWHGFANHILLKRQFYGLLKNAILEMCTWLWMCNGADNASTCVPLISAWFVTNENAYNMYCLRILREKHLKGTAVELSFI